MALPRVIDTGATAYTSDMQGKPACWRDNVFVPVLVGTDIEMHRSTNPVDNAFVHLDSANQPSLANGAQYFWGRQVFNVYAIISTNFLVTDGDTQFHLFDLENETWTRTDVVISNVTNTIVTMSMPSFCPGSDGEFHAIFPMARDKIMGTDYARCGYSYSTDSGATWTSPVFINTDNPEFDIRPMEIVPGTVGTGHAFYCRFNLSSGDERMYQRTGNFTGALQTERIDVDGANTYYFGAANERIMAGSTGTIWRSSTHEIKALYRGDGNSGTDLLFITFDANSDPSSFTTGVVQTSAMDLQANFDGAYDMGEMIAMYGKNTSSNIDFEDDSGTDTWTGSATTANTADPDLLNCQTYIRDGVPVLAFVYNDASNDPTYDEEALTSLPSTPTNLSDCEWPHWGTQAGPYEI